VHISIVARNEKLVSVERSKRRHGEFILSFDETFLNGLEDSELSASIAHELGHVWIFTHHPYLQTELLANQVALRVVTRENLEKIYEKVWKDKGKGDLKEFLGEETAVGLKPEIRLKSLPKTTDGLTNK
jgi:Rps23 Pro-64 3,4-dihydroxylase Tpa1-like proline 4-hydroxylase